MKIVKTPVLSERELTKERVRGYLRQFALPYVGKPANEEWLDVVAAQVCIWEGQAKAEVLEELFPPDIYPATLKYWARDLEAKQGYTSTMTSFLRRVGVKWQSLKSKVEGK